MFFNYFYKDVGISLKAYGNDVQNVKLYTQSAPQYEGDCEYRISSLVKEITGSLFLSAPHLIP